MNHRVLCILDTYSALFQLGVNRVGTDSHQVNQVKSLIDVVKKSLDVSQLCVKVDWTLKLHKFRRHLRKMSLHITRTSVFFQVMTHLRNQYYYYYTGLTTSFTGQPMASAPMCKQSAPHSKQITTPTPNHSIFTGRMLFLRAQPTVSKN